MQNVRSHYDDVRMGAIASQITSLTIVYSIVYSDADQRKHQSSASLAFVRGSHRGPVNFPHKWPVTRKMFPLDDVIMCLATSQMNNHKHISSKWWLQMLLPTYVIYLNYFFNLSFRVLRHKPETCSNTRGTGCHYGVILWHVISSMTLLGRKPPVTVKLPRTSNAEHWRLLLVILFVVRKEWISFVFI